MKYDICIIGAGIIGTTLAYTLKDKFSVCVIEKQSEPGLLQTSVNSSVIHSGIYYTENQNILKFCLDGKEKLKKFCKEHSVKYVQVGKHILCSPEKMEILTDRCGKYNIDYRICDDSIFLPDAALMDYKELTNKLYYLSVSKVKYYFGINAIKFENNYKIMADDKEI